MYWVHIETLILGNDRFTLVNPSRVNLLWVIAFTLINLTIDGLTLNNITLGSLSLVNFTLVTLL